MNYTYKCSECKKKYDVLIGTSDIMDSQGRIDQEKLSMRMYAARECECGGELYKIIEAHDFSFKEAGQYERARKMAQEFSGFDK